MAQCSGGIYAATMFAPTITFEMDGDASVIVCTGRCQMFGSIDLLEELLKIRDSRKTEGLSAINVLPRSCLDQCDYPPVMMSKSQHGVCAHQFAKTEELPEIIEAICSSE